eukprot:CAMPEP_0198114406 /NCGR_PEP_ID=MMETSP1442-20131203/5798_1 /TAXON_ID= /ORGANISM="Craspedostauros australis, Strain CCMP3328" /LENGTH=412 /DNA_ID=CAMNT_0043771711 /DNA_START=87 /DNA_END=1325 /DNA_ORIENTATION=+
MKFTLSTILAAASIITPVAGEVYLKEKFNDDAWTSRWTESTKWKPKAEMGTWKHTAGKWYGDAADKGIQTGQDARFYGLSAKLDKPFISGDKPLVIQYSVKHEQNLDCGGAYLKLLPGGDKFDAAAFGGDTPYGVMFGPDICGTSNRKTHVILHSNTKDENLLVNNEVLCEFDDVTHLYTLILRPDNTFEVRLDNKNVREGKLDDEFDFLEPKNIKDDSVTKPADWVDEAMMLDPEDVKPEGYDDIPAEIIDPEATKPDDWDDEDDGEWEAPMIDNPEFKGEWKQNKIPNPDYKGKWEAPMIDNPDYKYDDTMYMVCKDGCSHVGFELWQVTTGTIFDDIIVTDSVEEAEAFAKETFFAKKDGEKEMYDKHIAEQQKNDESAMSDYDYNGMGEYGDLGDLSDLDMDGMGEEL